MLKEKLYEKRLSRREMEIVEVVATGASNKETAKQLFVTEKTVKFHLTNIYKKLQVKNRMGLIVWCAPHIDFTEVKAKEPVAVDPAASPFGDFEIPSRRLPVGTA